jgi:hypothetical protein
MGRRFHYGRRAGTARWQPCCPGPLPLQHLHVDLRSPIKNAAVSVGMQDVNNQGLGTEKKLRVAPTDTWQTRSFELADFDIDLTHVYVIIEFVYTASDPPQSLEVRNIRLDCR